MVVRGVEPTVLHAPLRLFAVIGFSAAVMLLLYHLPFNWLGVTGSSTADLPSYLLAGSSR